MVLINAFWIRLRFARYRFVKCRFVRSKIYTFRFVCFQDVLKTSSRHVFKTSSTYVFKTSSRHVFKEDVFSVTLFRLPRKTSFARCLQDVFKTSRKTKNCYAEDALKMSSRHLEDQQMFAGKYERMVEIEIQSKLRRKKLHRMN